MDYDSDEIELLNIQPLNQHREDETFSNDQKETIQIKQEETSPIDQELPQKEEYEDLSERFTTDQIFENRESLINWAKETGKNVGTVVVIEKSDSTESGRTARLFLGCERGGKYRARNDKPGIKGKRRKTGTKLCECPFMFAGVFQIGSNDKWKVKVVCGRHNHPLMTYFEGHSSIGRLTTEEQQIVEEMTISGVKPKQTLTIIKNRNPTNASTLRHVYNVRAHKRTIEMGQRSQMQQLMKALCDNGYIEWSTRHKNTEVVRTLFWAHPESIHLAKCFPLVFLMDSTYKTNKFRWPLFEIVGVTSTGKTFSVCFALMEEESEEYYIWALEKFRSLLDQNQLPSVIVTDRELALINGLEKVFPSTKLHLCRWHISKNVMGKAKKYIDDKVPCDKFIEMWHELVEAENEDKYHNYVRQLEFCFSGHQPLLMYLKDYWLNPYKDRFVAAWTDQHMHLGNLTTNRAEGAHATLKRRLGSSKHDFLGMWKLMHPLIILQLTEIKASFEISMNRVQHEHQIEALKHVRGFIAINAIDIILQEKQRGGIIGLDVQACGCSLRRTHGLPCSHELFDFEHEGRSIPLSSIHSFWKKLSALPWAANRGDLDYRAEFHLFADRFNDASEDLKVYLLKRLKELVSPETSWLAEPKEKVKTRGRPKGANNIIRKWESENSTTRDPSGWEYELGTPNTLSSQISNISKKSPTAPVQKKPRTTKCNGDLINFLSQFPEAIRPFIVDIKNVKGGGHCGFRAVAQALDNKGEEAWQDIRRDLILELFCDKSSYLQILGGEEGYKAMEAKLNCFLCPCTEEHWMLIPQTGYLIASVYNVALVYLSSKQYFTFLPFKSTPKPIAQQRVIVIGLVNDNHFVEVVLKSGCPIPRTINL